MPYSPVIAMLTIIATITTTKNTVVPESSIDAIRRPGCTLTMRVACTAAGSSSGEKSSPTRSCSTPFESRRAVSSSSCAPEASTRMRCRRSSAARAPRYASCTLASLPAWAISSFAVPKIRGTTGREMLMPWIRSSRALRWLRNSTPERTSTTSPVTRNSCIRQDTVKSPKSTSRSTTTPSSTQPTAPCSQT